MATTAEQDAFTEGVFYGAQKAGGILASTLENPAEWLIQALGGSESTSGQRVNYRSALTIAYVWAANQIISGDVASLPFETKRREPDDDLILDRTHPVYWLMNGKANSRQSAYLFRETMTHWALLLGNGLAYILRNARLQPTQLIPAVPNELTPRLEGGELFYVNSRTQDVFAASDILHVRGLGDDIWGHSVLTLARNSFGLSLATDKHGAEHFKNGGQPKVILKHPTRLTPEKAAELLEAFERRHGENAKPALAHGGLEIESFPINNQDSQFNETRKQAIIEVAAWFNLPPHKLGDDGRVAYNGIQAENQAYLSQTLRRWLRRWETEVTCKLLTMPEQRSFATVVAHNPQPLVDMDTKGVTDEVVAQVQAMIISPNEARKRLGLPKVEGGDDRLNPATTSGGGEPAPPDDQPDAIAAVARQPFVALLAERLQRLEASMLSHAQARQKRGDGFGETWVEKWEGQAREYCGPALDAAGAVFSCTPLDTVETWVVDWASSVAAGGGCVPGPVDLAEQIIGEALCTN